ncbi:MAG: metal ABC transporter permease [Clostridium argentinense]|uniref:Metal ABC transporter permease n=1 Tax=Clostridium faecium TaxID=2762223 RepID=A0ABR8YQQ8_9CLOT|nr:MULTISPECIES: metal ABC transporter permease [Clostridium]MBD8046588.1 metal ABC transporter permease [Clostridium faecium]MBS5825343.1 metal ABC transporter permease [Clostridium argentinense]MDU1350054.1 metal ABC transporter permease [Clostridium argentinense]
MFQYEFMQNAFIAAIFISILCPLVGTFLVLKRYSMMGDTLAHSSFAGVAIGLVTGYSPILCAFIFTSICGLLIELLRNYYKKYAELILSIVLTLSIGIGITLVSMGKTNANINSFLFGSILTVTKDDLFIMLILSIISILILYKLYNKLVYITFDEEGAKVANIKVKLINYIFALLVGATISVSIRIMGILVMSSMIALPVATALQLNKGFKKTMIFSIIFGFIDIILGLISSYYLNCAPGGTIALISVFILVITIVFKSFKR